MDGPGTIRRQPFGDHSRIGQRGSATERRIGEGALAVFEEVGFSAARVAMITSRAGCSRPAFYQYFSSKEDVYWRLAGELGREMVALGRRLGPVGSGAEGIDHLTAWASEFASLYQTYRAVFGAFQAASRHNIEFARGSSAISGRLDAALLRAFGRDAEGHDRALASALAAVLIRCTFYWDALSAGQPVSRERLVDGLARCAHRLFHGPIPGVNIAHTATRRAARSSAAPTFAALPRVAAGVARSSSQTAARQRLLDAGTKVLPLRGYHNARVEDIVSAAQVSHGSFYRHFADKDDFFAALAEQSSAEMIRLLERFPAADDEEALRAWLADWFVSYKANGGVITVWQEMQEGGDHLVEYSQQVAALIVTGLLEMFRQRGQDDPLFDALTLLALIERLPYRTYTLRFTTMVASIDAAVAIVRRSIVGISG